ncbi:MAG: hypothetical protein ACHBNF_19985 [Chromatiales bacterium]
MSNYFDGLIRASGLGPSSAPRAGDHGITEVDAQHAAPPVAKPAATPAATAPAVAQAPTRNTRQTGIDTAPPVAAVTPTPVTLESPASVPPKSVADEHAEPVSTRTLLVPSGPSARPEPDAQDVGQAVVRAALRWVTADVQTQGARTETEIAREPAPPAEPAPDAKPHMLQMPMRVEPVRHPETTDRLPHRPIVTHQPTAKEDVVEISIGAIHLRVDAPSPQTVVQAPVPTTRSAADRPPPRSALSRRVLRRI